MMRKGWKTFGTILLICMLTASLIPANLYAEEAVAEEVVVAINDEGETDIISQEAATEEAVTQDPAVATEEAVIQDPAVATEEAEGEGTGEEAATTRASAGFTQAAATTAARPASAKKAAPKPKINIRKKKITIKKGTQKKLKFTVKNTSRKNIRWTSSNKKVARVNSKGVVKVLSGGKCVITARVKGTNIQDSIIVKGRDYYFMRVKTTGYCNCSSCAGPWAGCRTASGKYPRANHTIAVDRRLIKLGTRVKIGKTTYVAEDTGGGVRGRIIDIYYSSHSKAHRHGVKWVTAKIYF